MQIYIIIEAETAFELQFDVNRHFRIGYKPLGGVSSDGDNLFQAMMLG